MPLISDALCRTGTALHLTVATRRAIVGMLLSYASLPATAQTVPGTGVPGTRTVLPGGLLRHPAINAANIAFEYSNDIWIASRTGGLARPLSNVAGRKTFPQFSPDGQSVAFVSGLSLYVASLRGGAPRRVTYYPAGTVLDDWTPDGRLLFNTDAAAPPGERHLFWVRAAGGLAERMPVGYGISSTMSSDSAWIAYVPQPVRETLRRGYVGGGAPDIWLYNIRTRVSVRATEWPGVDRDPMWHNGVVYYLSDAGRERRLNVWLFNPATRVRRQITHVRDFDIASPAIGPGADGSGEIVFEYGGGLHVLDLATARLRTMSIEIPVASRPSATREADASRALSDWSPAPDGARAVLQARGDLWLVGLTDTARLNITRTSNATDRSPAWSPDGKWISYLSSEGGEYQLTVRDVDGRDSPRIVTSFSTGFRMHPLWSPDSKRIAFSDNTGSFYVHSLATGETRAIDNDPWGGPLYAGTSLELSWSPDSRWLVYTRQHAFRRWSLWAYDFQARRSHRLTNGWFSDHWPVFDRSGQNLYYVSARDFGGPVFGDARVADWGRSYTFPATQVVMMVPLQRGRGSASPLPNTCDRSLDNPPSVEIDVEGFEARAVRLPIARGSLSGLSVACTGELVFVRTPIAGAPAIVTATPRGDRERTLLNGIGSFQLVAQRIVARAGTNFFITSVGDSSVRTVSIGRLATTVNILAEWREVFADVWRQVRDLFVFPDIRGVNWSAMRTKYAPMVDSCATRADVNLVIERMLAEIGSSHMSIVSAGDVGVLRAVGGAPIGTLGLDLALDNGRYHIATVHSAAPWDDDARNRLTADGNDVRVGDVLTAVNATVLSDKSDPWSSFEGLIDRETALTLSRSRPGGADSTFSVTTTPTPLDREWNLRYRSWIEGNRRRVDSLSRGRVGYVYVPYTFGSGYSDFARLLFAQTDKEAIIIDCRWNGGGHPPDRFIDMLWRPILYSTVTRGTPAYREPYDAPRGALAMLVNGSSASGGELIAHDFRVRKLGAVIGTRTAGSGYGTITMDVLDGGQVSFPYNAPFQAQNKWIVEGAGLLPDIVVGSDPTARTDPQLDAAVRHLLRSVRGRPSRGR